MFSLLIQSTKNQRVDFVALNAPEIFERSRSLAFQKSIEGSCVCLDLSCKCLKKKAEVCCVFLLRMKAPVELHAFYLYSEGMEFARFQSCSLTEKLVQIFDLGFSVALTTPQTLILILKPSEGPSSKTAQFTVGLIMEELQIMKGRICDWAASLRVG